MAYPTPPPFRPSNAQDGDWVLEDDDERGRGGGDGERTGEGPLVVRRDVPCAALAVAVAVAVLLLCDGV